MNINVDNDIGMLMLAIETNVKKHQKRKGDSWKSCNIKILENKLCEEFEEWIESRDKHELVDIATVCMMLFNRELRKILGIKNE